MPGPLAKYTTMIMAAFIAFCFFMATPGVIWTFPEKNLVAGSTRVNDKINKTDVMAHAALFGFAMAVGFPLVQKIIGGL